MAENAFAAAVGRARASGRELLDLTVSNPTACGFVYDSEALLRPLGNVGALHYEPDAKGMRSAREAVAGYYGDHGAAVDPDAVVLTTSTSEAYGYLFKLLCDAGDEVLVARPSYPLFEYLADLDDVKLKSYPLFYDFGWWIDVAELERAITPLTRAILVVHPNNPTGNATGASERAVVEKICERHGLALIVDEVFLDYPVGAAELRSFAAGDHPVLTFVLSGMSKIAGLPQMKVGWLAAFGPGAGEGLGRLEVIGDTYLSMNAPAQLALPFWMAGRAVVQAQILARMHRNLDVAGASGVDLLLLDGGWSAVLRLPDRGGADAAALDLLERGVVVHPGSFYGMGEGGRAVVSLITGGETFAAGIGVAGELSSEREN